MEDEREFSQEAFTAAAAAAAEAFVGEGAGAEAETVVVADTVVMNNLGYFQLQASPGVRKNTE